MKKRFIAASLIGLGLAVAALQWLHIGLKFLLFFRDYKGELFVNHVGEDRFIMAYVVGFLMTLMGVTSLFLVRRERIGTRFLAWISLCLNLLAPVCLFIMHRMGILVEYGEAMRV